MRELEIYVHIPFCVRKCDYCDFLSAPATDEVKEQYVERVLEEIRQSVFAEEYEVTSVFFGGGTPSILPAEQLIRILEKLKGQFHFRNDAEITTEANPGTVDRNKLKAYREAGFNRISFGLQSANNEELRALGRIHTWEELQESFALARELGFTNINVDLMSALPGQTIESWRETLGKVLVLQPEHISAYSLIVEEGTPFYERYAEHPELLPDEDSERQMYYDTEAILKMHGYHRYEISNYAKPGYECRHNLGYWERKEYIGFGLGAASLLQNIRMTNETDLQEYLQGHFHGSVETLTGKEIREEHFFLGLRKMEGVQVGGYDAHYRELIEKLKKDGLLVEEKDHIRLTRRGIDVSNYVLAQFLDE